MDLVREPAPWMVDVDERILETLSVYGNLRLYPLRRRLDYENRGELPVGYVLLRCKRLREYALLTQQDGYFRLTDTGRDYLDGEMDATLLTAADDPAGEYPEDRPDERDGV